MSKNKPNTKSKKTNSKSKKILKAYEIDENVINLSAYLAIKSQTKNHSYLPLTIEKDDGYSVNTTTFSPEDQSLFEAIFNSVIEHVADDFEDEDDLFFHMSFANSPISNDR